MRQIIFSPDGRWVVSGGDDGLVKLWDLTAGRLVHEFTQHSAPVSGLAMHPTEFLMASASVDRTLRLWDLESFEQVCCMPPDSGQIRRIAFSEDGSALLSGAEESLRVWGWEPVRCYEQADVRWSRLADMCIAPGQQTLIAGSVREAIVAVWNVDMKAMKPFVHSTEPPAVGQPAVRSPRPARADTPLAGARVGSEATPPPAHRTVQAPRDGATESAGICAHMPSSPKAAAMPAPPSTTEEDAAVQCARMHIAECRAQLAAARRASQGPDAGSARSGATAPSQPARKPSTIATDEIMAAAAASATEALSASGNHASIGTSMTDTLKADAPPSAKRSGLPPTAPPSTQPPRRMVEAPSGRVEPGSARVDGVQRAAARAPPRTDEQVLTLLAQGGDRQDSCLNSRLDALRALHSFWEAGDVKKASQQCLNASARASNEGRRMTLESRSLPCSADAPSPAAARRSQRDHRSGAHWHRQRWSPRPRVRARAPTHACVSARLDV